MASGFFDAAGNGSQTPPLACSSATKRPPSVATSARAPTSVTPDKATLLRSLHLVFRDDMQRHFTEQLIDLWNGKVFQQREAINYALGGEPVDVYMQFSVLPGHEHDWALVLVSLTDITARKKAEAYLEFLANTTR